MKKVMLILMCLTMALSLCACGGTSSPAPAPDTPIAPNEPSTPTQAPGPEPTTAPTPTPEPPKEPTVEIVSEQLIVETSLGYTTSTYLAEIKNTSDFPVKLSDISFDLETADGTLVKVIDYVTVSPTTLDVGQSAYICEPAVTMLDSDIDANAATVVKLSFDIDKASLKELPVEIVSVSLTNKMGFPNIVGKAKNNGTEDLTFVYICAPLYSADGVLQTVITTYVDLAAGEEGSFDQMAVFADPNADYSSSVLGEIAVYPLF